MTPIPVVQVLFHSPWYFRDSSRPMDAISMTDDWHVRTAMALEAAFPGRFALECWRPDWREPKERQVTAGGLPCRIFPSRRAPAGKFLYEVSLPMIRALWRRARRERFILHMHEMHSLTGLLAGFLPGGALKAAHTHGSPAAGLRQSAGRGLLRRLALAALGPLESLSLSRYRHLFAISDRELSHLLSLGLPASKLTMGVDFERFTPQDKAEARMRLGLPREAKIILYTGRFFRLKGADSLLSAMAAVRAAEPKAYLLMLGGLPQDDLYAEVMAGADKALPRVPYEHMAGYVAASDLCVPNVSDPGLLGIGMATVEAWAMDRPVLTSALEEFPGPPGVRDAIGVAYRPGRDNLAEAILKGLSLPDGASPRAIAKRYYDWPVIAGTLAGAYQEIWNS